MSTVLFNGNRAQFLDSNGDPYAGGEVYFYEVGTTTKKDAYTTSDLSTPVANPLTLDSEGACTAFLNGDYTIRVEDADGNLVEETDNVNPDIETETSGGNLIANGSFETAGNSSTDADGWTLTPQSDGTVERITTDNYDGAAALKFTSDGSGGGQADTDAFFAVSPGREYEVSFALNCSVADIRNIVQVRYFDEDKSFLSSSSVYDEDTNNPTSWEVKSFADTPPSNARFAKLRILGADQSDATVGEAKFDEFTVRITRFPNVNADVTATDEQMNAVLASHDTAIVELGGDFDAGQKVVCERVGNIVTISSDGALSHTSMNNPSSDTGVIPSQFRPSSDARNCFMGSVSLFQADVDIHTLGIVKVVYVDHSGAPTNRTSTVRSFSISYVITG